MKLPSVSSASYNSTAKALHWIIALAIIFMLGLGWVMTSDLPKQYDISKFALFQLHKSVGLSILVLSLFRLFWRLTHKAPPLPLDMPVWERFAAHATHWIFYALIIGMPLTGWIIVSASPMNLPTLYFSLFPWPHLPVAPSKDTSHAFGQIHGYLAYLTATLIALHIGAAWKHHLFNRDNVLLHMAPKAFHGFLDRLRGL